MPAIPLNLNGGRQEAREFIYLALSSNGIPHEQAEKVSQGWYSNCADLLSFTREDFKICFPGTQGLNFLYEALEVHRNTQYQEEVHERYIWPNLRFIQDFFGTLSGVATIVQLWHQQPAYPDRSAIIIVLTIILSVFWALEKNKITLNRIPAFFVTAGIWIKNRCQRSWN